jgi:N-acetylneuraminic acid mutarotase
MCQPNINMNKSNFSSYLLLALIICLLKFNTAAIGQSWLQKADIPDSSLAGRWGAYCFSINNKIYVGGGYVGNFTSKRDLWEYDISTDTWNRKQDLPGSTNRTSAVSFSINGKGYVGFGAQDFNTINTVFLNDLWEYDPVMDSWLQKANFPDSARMKTSCFVVNDMAYIVGGLTGYPEMASNDLWMYDPATDQWSSKQPYPAELIYNSMSFAIGNFGYTIGGTVKTAAATRSSTSKNMWQYDPVNNNWNAKADYCDTLGRESGIAFVLNNQAYVGLGMTSGSTIYFYKEFCMYDTINGWSSSLSFAGMDRAYGIAATANNRAYAGAGFIFTSAENYFNDWYEFTPVISGISASLNNEKMIISPNPARDVLHIELKNSISNLYHYKIINSLGVAKLSGSISGSSEINLSNLSEGLYILSLSSESKVFSQRFIITK